MFFASSEFISRDRNAPTIFQNVINAKVEAGTPMNLAPGFPSIPMPIGIETVAFTEATGFVDEDDAFKGILRLEYHYHLLPSPGRMLPQVAAMLRNVPSRAVVIGDGVF